MLVLKYSHRSHRPRRNRYVSLFPEGLEYRVVPSTSSEAVAVAPPVLFSTNYEEYHVPGSYPSWLTPGPQGILSQDNGSAEGFLYTPQQIRTAYGVNDISFGGTPGDGTGQTIAIIDAYDDPSFVDSTAGNFSSSDLAQFDKAFGLPDPPSFTKYTQYGQTTNLPGTDPKGPGTDDLEVEARARRSPTAWCPIWLPTGTPLSSSSRNSPSVRSGSTTRSRSSSRPKTPMATSTARTAAP
jgi:hypothetical protein